MIPFLLFQLSSAAAVATLTALYVTAQACDGPAIANESADGPSVAGEACDGPSISAEASS
jgi:hypothetical protein